MVNLRIREKTGKNAQSIAVITTWGKGVAIVSAALRNGKPIPHHVVIDEEASSFAVRQRKTEAAPQNVLPGPRSLNAERAAAARRVAGEAQGRRAPERPELVEVGRAADVLELPAIQRI